MVKFDFNRDQLSLDMIYTMFKSNSVETIQEYCTDSAISIMYSVVGGGQARSTYDMLQEISDSVARVVGNTMSVQNVVEPSKQSAVIDESTIELKQLASIQVLNDITVKLLQSGNNLLQINLELNGRTVLTRSKSKWSGETSYEIEDLGSGRSDSGTYYISLAVYEDTMYYFSITAEIDASGKAVQCEIEGWSNSETSPWYEYDELAQNLVVRSPQINR